MNKYRQNDIISIQQGTYEMHIDYYKINRVTNSYYEISIESGDLVNWRSLRALMIYHADINPRIKLWKRDIGWAFRNL